MATDRSKLYKSMSLYASIGGIDVQFMVEFAEPITDAAKLPTLRIFADSGRDITYSVMDGIGQTTEEPKG